MIWVCFFPPSSPRQQCSEKISLSLVFPLGAFFHMASLFSPSLNLGEIEVNFPSIFLQILARPRRPGVFSFLSLFFGILNQREKEKTFFSFSLRQDLTNMRARTFLFPFSSFSDANLHVLEKKIT